MSTTNPQLLCRLCLCKIEAKCIGTIDLRSSNAEDFIEKIHKTFPMQLSLPWNWPHKICRKCVSLVQQYHEFHEQVAENQDRILELFGLGVQQEIVEVQEELDMSIETTDLKEEDETPVKDVFMDEEVIIKEEGKQKRPKKKLKDNSMASVPSRRSRRQIEVKKEPPIPAKKEITTEIVAKIPRTIPTNTTGIDKIIDERIRSFYTLKCTLCPDDHLPFDKFMSLLAHYRTEHNQKGFFECCNKKFSKRHELYHHIDLHVNPKAIACETCAKTFPTQHQLNNHKKIHLREEEKGFACEICPKRFVSEYGLNYHTIRAHAPASERPIQCAECDKRFVNQCELRTHYKLSHSNLRPFICEFCALSFKTKPYLNNHRASHNSEPVKCDECGKVYSTDSLLRRHKIRSHSSTGPVDCPQCGLTYNNISSLRNHITRMHRLNRKKHQCNVCGREFKTKARFREHMASLHGTGEKLYQCLFCDLEYNNNANRYNHQKLKHPVEYEAMKEQREQLRHLQARKKGTKIV